MDSKKNFLLVSVFLVMLSGVASGANVTLIVDGVFAEYTDPDGLLPFAEPGSGTLFRVEFTFDSTTPDDFGGGIPNVAMYLNAISDITLTIGSQVLGAGATNHILILDDAPTNDDQFGDSWIARTETKTAAGTPGEALEEGFGLLLVTISPLLPVLPLASKDLVAPSWPSAWDTGSISYSIALETPSTREVLASSSANITSITVVPLPASHFDDVSSDHWAFPFIETLAASGITAGCGNGNYCPFNPVTRAEMAVFLLRARHGGDYVPAAASGEVFVDVPSSYWGAPWIEQLAAEGITGGCGSTNYCPFRNVTRAEMAVFLLRAVHGSDYMPPPASGEEFLDVPAGFWGASWIEQLKAEGITGGCGNSNYCPFRDVTRAEMAVFLVRAFGL